MISQAHARIGYTLDQCRERTAKKLKTKLPGAPLPASLRFIAENLYIYAIFSGEGKVVDIIYFDNTAKAELPAALKAKLWDRTSIKDEFGMTPFTGCSP